MNPDSQNPYSTPQAETLLSSSAQVDTRTFYVENDVLVVRHKAKLPNICIKTGESLPDAKRSKKTLFWAHPAWALLILVGLLVYFIVYLCIRKKVTLSFCISEPAKKKRLITILTSLGITLGSLVLAIFFFSTNDSSGSYTAFGIIGIILFTVGLIITALLSNLFRIKKHQDGWFYITGVGKGFLDAIEDMQSKLIKQ